MLASWSALSRRAILTSELAMLTRVASRQTENSSAANSTEVIGVSKWKEADSMGNMGEDAITNLIPYVGVNVDQRVCIDVHYLISNDGHWFCRHLTVDPTVAG